MNVKEPTSCLYKKAAVLNLIDEKRSFCLLAGAGAGKTRALVDILNSISEETKNDIKLHRKKIGVITYTNAAADEIKRRIGAKEYFSVSTIHSFIWELIKYYPEDIRRVLLAAIEEKIKETSPRSKKKINELRSKQEEFREAKVIAYEPTSTEVGKGFLSHNDVLDCGAKLLQMNVLKEILASRFPIILIDECQDTDNKIFETLVLGQSKTAGQVVGIFGDWMQRIYPTGPKILPSNLPENWTIFHIEENNRSSKRIVSLCNAIAKYGSNQQQTAVKKTEGLVRFFAASIDEDRDIFESNVRKEMTELLKLDRPWSPECFSLVHKMTPAREGFASFVEPLYSVPEFKDLLKEMPACFASLSSFLGPIVRKRSIRDEFVMARHILENVPTAKDHNRKVYLIQLKEKVDKLQTMVDENQTLRSLIKYIEGENLYELPPLLTQAVSTKDPTEAQLKIREALQVSLDVFFRYVDYVTGKSNFHTHHGVKGLEFKSVMVLIDDSNAKWGNYKYENYLLKEGNFSPETTDDVERVRRLFYVACSRPTDYLAVVAYVKDPERIEERVKNLGFFNENEISALRQSVNK